MSVAGTARASTTTALAVDALGVRRGEQRVLEDISFDIDRGASAAIMGRSGSGKSTLLACLAGIIRPSEGSVQVEAVDLASLDADRRAALRLARIGVVFQQGELVAELSLLDNAALPLRLLGVKRAAARTEAAEVMARLGIEHLSERLPHEVSGGEAQRAAVARAVVTRPAIVLADEPTGSLDRSNAAVVVELLASLPGSFETALLVVTHDGDVARHFGSLLRLDDGSLVD